MTYFGMSFLYYIENSYVIKFLQNNHIKPIDKVGNEVYYSFHTKEIGIVGKEKNYENHISDVKT